MIDDPNDNPILSKMVSARPDSLPSVSGSKSGLCEAQERLRPADPDDILTMLAPVLALVGAVGMSPDDRAEWLAAAVDALKHIPFDLLQAGLKETRRRADHPSKVIPFVLDYCEDLVAWRKQELDRARSRARAADAPPSLPAPGQTYCTAEEAAEIVDRVFPQARSLRDTPPPIKRGPPRMPTKADYLALGVDPAVVEAMG
jgi:hypothetical protein